MTQRAMGQRKSPSHMLGRLHVLASKLSVFASLRASQIALLGVCIYIASLALPLPWDIPLLGFGVLSVLAMVWRPRQTSRSWSPLHVMALLFVVATGTSTLVSEDISRSLQLSAALLPALLLFVVIAQHLERTRDTQFLYLTFSAAGLGLAFSVLWTAWGNDWRAGSQLIWSMQHPTLAVANDLTFLAVIAPLSVALLCQERRGWSSIWAVCSMVLSLIAAGTVRVLSAGALASLVSFCVAAAVELTLARQWVVIMLFALLGVIVHLSSLQAQSWRVKP